MSALKTLRQQFRHFIPTPRLLLLLLLPLLLVVTAVWLPLLGWLSGLLWLAVGYTAVQDARRTATPQQIRVQRYHHRKLAIRADNAIELTIANDSAQPLALTLRESLPDTFKIARAEQVLQADLPPQQQVRLVYQVQPTRRGEYRIGPLLARWPSRWGLFERQATFDMETQAKVYPNLLEIRLYDELARQGRMDAAGLRPLRQSGEGGEFEQLRDYVPDDDYRRISWTATARHGKPITVEYSPERSQNIMIVVDTGRRMVSRPLGEARTTRLDLIINAVLMFGYVAIARGDRVGLMTFDNQVHRYLPPRGGMGQFYRLVEALHDVEGQLVEPDYGLALRYLQAQRQNRSLIMLLTDPTGQEAANGLVGQLGAFYPRHLPMCVVLSDPAVLDASQRRPYSTDAIYQRAVAEQILDERRLWLNRLQQRGVHTLDVPAHQLTAAVVNKYLEMKAGARI